jgi:hypothetical protein
MLLQGVEAAAPFIILLQFGVVVDGRLRNAKESNFLSSHLRLYLVSSSASGWLVASRVK